MYSPNGLELKAINNFLENNPHVLLDKFELNGHGEQITNEELLTLDVDLLVPAALESQITEKNADQIQASLIVEGANGPTTFEADEILNDRGVVVVPDILANAGGVIVSYFEWVQDLQSFFWDVEEVRAQLTRKMESAFEEVWSFAEDRETSMRSAAYMLGVQRVANAIQHRGLFP